MPYATLEEAKKAAGRKGRVGVVHSWTRKTSRFTRGRTWESVDVTTYHVHTYPLSRAHVFIDGKEVT